MPERTWSEADDREVMRLGDALAVSLGRLASVGASLLEDGAGIVESGGARPARSTCVLLEREDEATKTRVSRSPR